MSKVRVLNRVACLILLLTVCESLSLYRSMDVFYYKDVHRWFGEIRCPVDYTIRVTSIRARFTSSNHSWGYVSSRSTVDNCVGTNQCFVNIETNNSSTENLQVNYECVSLVKRMLAHNDVLWNDPNDEHLNVFRRLVNARLQLATSRTRGYRRYNGDAVRYPVTVFDEAVVRYVPSDDGGVVELPYYSAVNITLWHVNEGAVTNRSCIIGPKLGGCDRCSFNVVPIDTRVRAAMWDRRENVIFDHVKRNPMGLVRVETLLMYSVSTVDKTTPRMFVQVYKFYENFNNLNENYAQRMAITYNGRCRTTQCEYEMEALINPHKPHQDPACD